MKEALTHEEMVAAALALRPRDAGRYSGGERGRGCSTDVFNEIRMPDGTTRPLAWVSGRYGAGYARVSSQRQQQDGWSLEDQVARIVRHFTDRGLAFRVFSDAGLPGSLAYRDPAGGNHLSRKLSQQRARRYEAAYRKIFLENPRYARHRASMEAHLANSGEASRAAGLDGLEDDGATPRMGRPTSRATYRPGLTALVSSLPDLHELAVTDLSRLSRSQILFADLVERLTEHRVRVAGLVEDLSWVSGTGEIGADIVAFVLARIAEHRLGELTVNVLRGQVTKLEAGEPCGNIPSWLSTDASGKAFLNDRAPVARRIVDLALAGTPYIRIAIILTEDGVPIFGNNGKGDHAGSGRQWETHTVKRILESPALKGVLPLFGIGWNVLPPVATDAEWDRLQARIAASKQGYSGRTHRYLASHLFRCSCGFKLSHRTIVSGHDQYACTANLPTRRAQPHIRHVALNQRSAEAFLDELMRTDPSAVIGAWRDTNERCELRDELAGLEARRQSLLAGMPAQEEQAYREAAAKARLLCDGDEDAEIVAAVARRALAPVREEIARIEAAIGGKRRQLDTFLPSDEIAALEDRARAWDSLTTEARNALLLTVFKEWRVEGVAPNETVVPILNGIEETALPPIHLQTKTMGRAFFRRFPSVSDWVGSWLPDDGAAIAGTD